VLSPSSNCCRVDAIKASANQLKMQLAQHKPQGAETSDLRTASQQLQSLEVQIKMGDATKAELALSAAKSSIDRLQFAANAEHADQQQAQAIRPGMLDVYV
jgi:hypothetical protein